MWRKNVTKKNWKKENVTFLKNSNCDISNSDSNDSSSYIEIFW